MKKITAMLMALTMAALSLTGCSGDEGSSSASEQNISGLSSENETFVTTTTTAPIPTETTTEDTSLITADTREELATGLLEAICAGDKDTANRYNVTNKTFISIQETLNDSKIKAGLSETDEVTVEDFEIYFTGPNYAKIGSATDTVNVYIISPKLTSIELGAFGILFDYENEKYIFKKTSDRYSYASSPNHNGEYAQNGYATNYDYVLSRLTKAQKA